MLFVEGGCGSRLLDDILDSMEVAWTCSRLSGRALMPSVLLAVSNGETVVERDSGGRGAWAANDLEGAASDMTIYL